ncbi:hypothetical protein XELAEV_18043025mg [Xenopus laevis]|uniref:Uncharacterized protein n=1 Tax=Xenopus laevis TaxID=8355 RepID=A0A974C5B1_XENLA|nr:hypothetical protein XELAEV_18043025mg [Xenopus laevis]
MTLALQHCFHGNSSSHVCSLMHGYCCQGDLWARANHCVCVTPCCVAEGVSRKNQCEVQRFGGHAPFSSMKQGFTYELLYALYFL